MGFKLGTGGSGGGVSFGPPTAVIDIGDTQQAGAATTAARSDHQHAFPAPANPPLAVAATNTPGSATTPARSDHTHAHTAADHLAGGHADLSSAFAAAGAPGAAVTAHETTYDHGDYNAAVSAVATKISAADHAGIDHAGITGVPTTLGTLADVSVAGANPGDTIEYDGTVWGLATGIGGGSPLTLARHFMFGGS
ncbi:hypothetical protein [Mycolicibacterium sp.]|uniref:hypothetical protein n=1 Tax=Mycolicibacterium sp. TaxID=2320850 RepID=UPI00355E8929